MIYFFKKAINIMAACGNNSGGILNVKSPPYPKAGGIFFY